MLPATTPAASPSSPLRANGIDNRQFLEFLALVREWKELGALLSIEPTAARRRRHPHRQQAPA